jgi:hypothetical protein
VLRKAWERLANKQWLILYPLAVGIIDSIAFFAVYAATVTTFSWNEFFLADFDRWSYVREHFVTHFSWTPALAVALVAGLALCVLTAMIRAPYFRAIVGSGYPRAPRGWNEALQLTLFYLFSNVILWLAPQFLPDNAFLSEFVSFALYIVLVLIVLTDYVIVFEQRPFAQALRRGVRLVGRRWVVVVLVVLIVQLVYYGVYRLYDTSYSRASGIFVLLPLSHILVQAFLTLVVDLVLIFLYQQLRRPSA